MSVSGGRGTDLRKALATFFACLFVLSTPIVLLMADVDMKLLQSGTYKQELIDQDAYRRLPTLIAQQIAQIRRHRHHLRLSRSYRLPAGRTRLLRLQRSPQRLTRGHFPGVGPAQRLLADLRGFRCSGGHEVRDAGLLLASLRGRLGNHRDCSVASRVAADPDGEHR